MTNPRKPKKSLGQIAYEARESKIPEALKRPWKITHALVRKIWNAVALAVVREHKRRDDEAQEVLLANLRKWKQPKRRESVDFDPKKVICRNL